MEAAKDYHKNSKENKKGKTKSKHQESPTRTKVHESPTMASTLFPFVRKSFASEKWKSENKGVLFSCPEKSCKCSFTVSTADLESQIIVCPKGHNICSECLDLSHYPISCKILKEWMKTEFSSLKKIKESELLLLNCPLCKAVVKEEQKNGFNNCPKCNKSYCSKCMQEIYWREHSHCVKNHNKGEIRNKTEESLKHLEFLKMDFTKFMQEKTREEEEFKEQIIYIEEKIEKLKEENEFEKEEMFEFIYFLDAVNEMKHSLYLGKNFAFYYEGKEREERIQKILEEMEELYQRSLLFTQKNHGSIDLFYKKFKEFIKENENRKELKKIKSSMCHLEKIF